MVGARIGATPTTSISRENRRAAAIPSNRSRTIAIATTAAAAAPRPCSTRSEPSTARFGARTQSTEASTCTAMPTSSGSRRPIASASGPASSWPNARPTSVPVSVSCTAAALACRSVVIVGSDGRYMSMVSGPSAVRKPSTSTIRKRRPNGSDSPGESWSSGGATGWV